MQTTIVIFVIVLSLALLARKAYRTFVPAPGKSCGGDCCGAGSKDQAPKAAQGQPIQMVRSSDLARRAAELKHPGA